ncbi:MAG: hypothetical protein JRG86_14615 [Deltaproteobacteria bacterium]|nr:hypothetical protein [Deltaproteobacteria bacterium]MBW2499398.1 hypothetical protein [Deltaproteobacteria bacterium]
MRKRVLGMRKSGTTLVAETLTRARINMGEFREELDYETGNKYEPFDFRTLNRELRSPYLLPPLGHVLGRSAGGGLIGKGLAVHRQFVVETEIARATRSRRDTHQKALDMAHLSGRRR